MFTLPELNYAYDALGKYISKDIMQLHHGKHHQAYIDKLNAALEGYSDLRQLPIEKLVSHINELPSELQVAVRNHGGGHYNHMLFWQWMSPDGGGEPSGELGGQLVQQYGSFQGFVDEFSDAAMKVFGSGWVWLQPDMSIITTANQDTPLMTGAQAPLLGLDVWEHAYYLDYKNKRDDYIAAWWNVVNWDVVAQRYAE